MNIDSCYNLAPSFTICLSPCFLVQDQHFSTGSVCWQPPPPPSIPGTGIVWADRLGQCVLPGGQPRTQGGRGEGRLPAHPTLTWSGALAQGGHTNSQVGVLVLALWSQLRVLVFTLLFVSELINIFLKQVWTKCLQMYLLNYVPLTWYKFFYFVNFFYFFLEKNYICSIRYKWQVQQLVSYGLVKDQRMCFIRPPRLNG